jgi:serine/threonine protein kinase
MERDPLIGTQVRDYLIRSSLGEGGMARVYRAYHLRLRREDAIKIILPGIAHDATFKARFEQEAQLAATLDHPNIVSIYDFGEDRGLTYLAMQYVGGGTLRQSLQHQRPLEAALTIHYILQMARALHHAHQHGIVHRDVKPQNMLISASDPHQLLLSDFGIAKIFDRGQEETRTGYATLPATPLHPLTTSTGQIIGTAAYMAPEQVERQPVDARTDVYALGIVLYQMLTGNVPFQSTTTVGLMYQHVHTLPIPVRQVNPNAPETLADITERALAKKPAQRFPSAEAMAMALESARASLTRPIFTVPNPQTGTPYTSHPSTHTSAPTPPTYNIPSQSQISPASYYPPANNAPPYSIPTPRRKNWFPVVGAILVALLLVAFTIIKWPASSGPLPFTAATPTPTGAFTDTFSSNNYDWPQANSDGLTASIEQGHYTLTTDNQQNTHFPYPKAVSLLPTRFTFTTEIAQDQGSLQVFYGLVFYLQPERAQCYAFIINNSGNYQILRYDGGNAPFKQLWGGNSTAIQRAIHSKNRLQVIARNGQYSFTINDQAVPLKPGQSTLSDTTYPTGEPGLFVAGPSTSFTVTKVQLSIP